MVAAIATICLGAGGRIDRKPQKTEQEDPPATNLADVKRIFVGPLVGGKGADEVRELIIASLYASKQFIITENEEKADAVLKGAGDDKAFTDTFDSQKASMSAEMAGPRPGVARIPSTGRASTVALGPARTSPHISRNESTRVRGGAAGESRWGCDLVDHAREQWREVPWRGGRSGRESGQITGV